MAMSITLKKICDDFGLTAYGVRHALKQYQKVISEITHGMLSKLTYEADDILRTAQDRWCDTCELMQAQQPRVLSLEEVKNSKGAGWLENWFQPDDEGPEIKELLECAWIRGAAVAYDTMGYTDYYGEGEIFDRMYGKKFGFRIWTNKPTPALMEREPWEL